MNTDNGGDFVDNSGKYVGSAEYTYDANGNLTMDKNKGILSITYNYLNQPTSISVVAFLCLQLKDHLGNIRIACRLESGILRTRQVDSYYPFGMNIKGLSANSSTGIRPNEYLYNGKMMQDEMGLGWLDYGARFYDAVLGRFHTQDRFSEKYNWLSPYQYAANNPINYIDVNGDSITVLNLGTGKNQHMALLIQNESGKWQYFSVNGDNVYVSGKHTGGRESDDLAVGEFNSPQEFMNSYYNQEGDKADETKNSYGFKEGYIIPTSKEQDKTIREKFTDISENEEYSLNPDHPNQCATTVQRSLNKAGIETKETKTITDRSHGEEYTVKLNPYFPSAAFHAIIKNNPNGQYIKRTKK